MRTSTARWIGAVLVAVGVSAGALLGTPNASAQVCTTPFPAINGGTCYGTSSPYYSPYSSSYYGYPSPYSTYNPYAGYAYSTYDPYAASSGYDPYSYSDGFYTYTSSPYTYYPSPDSYSPTYGYPANPYYGYGYGYPDSSVNYPYSDETYCFPC